MADNRTLPKKEAGLFRDVVKLFETKQYKKAIKSADLILKKFPSHGETLAMKGLTLISMQKKEEGQELIKLGLRNDLQSYVCWHVYGLMYRSERNYKEAIKCYRNALRLDPNNLQILRDVSLLQVQLRDTNGFLETRQKLLILKSNQKNNWISYAVGAYLDNQFSLGVSIIDSFLATQEVLSPNFDDSELLLFRNLCLEKDGRLEEALQHLGEVEVNVIDKLSWMIRKAETLLRLLRYGEAKQAFKDLLLRNPDNYKFHAGIQSSVLQLPKEVIENMLALKACDLPSTVLVLTETQIDDLKQLYQELSESIPSNRVNQRIRLTFLIGEEFRASASNYIQSALNKGIPSLGSDLSSFYRIKENDAMVCAKEPFDLQNCESFHVIQDLTNQIVDSLNATGKFPGKTDQDAIEPPTTLLWAWFLQAQQLEALGSNQEALEVIGKCIDHTPTAVDFYERKARLIKKSGDILGAAQAMDEARQLDLADRYINNKATKYFLRADQVSRAQATIGLFTKHEGDTKKYLFDLQCMWYELECAESEIRKRRYGRALKQFYAIDKHFQDFVEDQFDFHNYCIRKMTIRSYLDVLKMEDSIFRHEFFVQAAQGIIRCYIKVFDKTDEIIEGKVIEDEEEDKEEQTSKKDKKKGNKKRHDEDESSEKKDEDPFGDSHLQKNPLEEANKFVQTLNKFSSDNIMTHILTYDVQIRRQKYLLALRTLIKGYKINKDDPEFFFRFISFLKLFRDGVQLNPSVFEVLTQEINQFEESKSELNQLVEEYVQRTSTQQKTILTVLAAIHSYHLILPAEAAKSAISDVISHVSFSNLRAVTPSNCTSVLEFLQLNYTDESFTESFRTECSLKFPLAKAFEKSF